MNLLNRNKRGLFLIDSHFASNILSSIDNEKKTKDNLNINGHSFTDISKDNNIILHREMLEFKCQKTIKISDSIYTLSQSIDINSIYKNIDSIDLKFTDISILMPSDEIGVICIKKVGDDIFFIWSQNLLNINNIQHEVNIYNFFTKSFSIKAKSEKSEIVLKILTYLFYGDIIEKKCIPKSKIKCNSFFYIKNDTKNNIWYADSSWKINISVVDKFKVSGHFRLQPIGERRERSKLIFIE